MCLKRQIQPLKAAIENFVFHRRHKLVLELLWKQCASRFYEDNVFTRRAMLVEIIDQLAEEECPGALNRIKQFERLS